MHALARIQKRRRIRYWLNAVHVSLLVFFADQILKTWALRTLAPGDQAVFFGQSYFVLTHLQFGVDAFLLSALEWVLWFTVGMVLVLRSADADATEILSSMVLLAAGLSNALTRTMLGHGLNVFAVQDAPGNPWLSFNLAHIAISITAFLLTASWLRALWPESLAESRHSRV